MHNRRNPGSLTQWLRRALFVIVLALAACGGGGGGDNSGGSGSGNTGSGGGTPPPPTAATPVNNAVTVSVAQGLQGTLNIPTVSVTVCQPGTGNCQTIDNVQVDTESFGLRLMSSALPSTVALPVAAASNGATLAECANFADGFMWGTVRTADVKIGGETASSIPVHVVGDLPASTIPSACQGLGAARSQPGDIGANGILGIGVAPTDCGASCAATPPTTTLVNSGYYGCPSGANCAGTVVNVAQTVANPVPKFATDNNGVSLQLPGVPANGAPSVTGQLVFGIGTQSNNAMTATRRLATNNVGDVAAATSFSSTPLNAFLDSGSNGLFFNDSAIQACVGPGDWPDFYCPSSTQTRTATLTGVDGSTVGVSFNIQNAQMLVGTGNLAFNDIGGPFTSQADLDLGLPFFFGKTVFYGYGAKPFVAF